MQHINGCACQFNESKYDLISYIVQQRLLSIDQQVSNETGILWKQIRSSLRCSIDGGLQVSMTSLFKKGETPQGIEISVRTQHAVNLKQVGRSDDVRSGKGLVEAMTQLTASPADGSRLLSDLLGRPLDSQRAPYTQEA